MRHAAKLYGATVVVLARVVVEPRTDVEVFRTVVDVFRTVVDVALTVVGAWVEACVGAAVAPWVPVVAAPVAREVEAAALVVEAWPEVVWSAELAGSAEVVAPLVTCTTWS